jgi:hypothetical protein
MNASELRLGNLITKYGDTIVVETITTEHFTTIKGESISAKGITINPQWLEKLNFTKDESGHYSRYSLDEEVLISFLKDENVENAYVANLCVNEKSHLFELTRQPKYVHELQNLFFALTGEELSAVLD